ARPSRIQSAFVSDEEAQQSTAFWKEQSGGYVPPELPDVIGADELIPAKGGSRYGGGTSSTGYPEGGGRSRATGGGGGEASAAMASIDGDDIMEQARALADIYDGKVSTSLLQR